MFQFILVLIMIIKIKLVCSKLYLNGFPGIFNIIYARFDLNNFITVFENHVHSFKRMKKLRGGSEDIENGVLYLGDGCW